MGPSSSRNNGRFQCIYFTLDTTLPDRKTSVICSAAYSPDGPTEVRLSTRSEEVVS